MIAEPWQGGKVKAIYAEALRAPTMDERTYRDPQRVLPSANLEAETVRSLEFVLSERFGSQNVVVGLFRSWWSNMIFRHRCDTLDETSVDSLIIQRAQQSGVLTNNIEYAFQYRNMGSLDNWGLNAGWEGALRAGQLTYALHLTAAHARSRGTDNMRSLTVTPAWFGNARVAFDFDAELPTLALAAHFGGERLADVVQDAAASHRPRAPASLDLRMTATVPFPGFEQFTYRLMIDYSFAPESPFSAAEFGAGGLRRRPSSFPRTGSRLFSVFNHRFERAFTMFNIHRSAVECTTPGTICMNLSVPSDMSGPPKSL